MPPENTSLVRTDDPWLPSSEASSDHNLLPLYLLRFDRPNTRRAYARDLIDFFRTDFITPELVRQVDFRHVNAYLAALENAGLKPATLQRRTASLRGFFSWLIALRVLTQNPADRQLVRKVRRVSDKERLMTVLTRDQASDLISAVDADQPRGVRDQTLLMVLLHCVLRRSEAAAMDFRHLHRSGAHWILDLPHTKGGADQYVKVPEHIAHLVLQLKAHYGYDEGPVWRSLGPRSKGRRLSDRSIYGIVKRYANLAGIYEGVGAHTLRHTGCTLAIEAGAPLHYVQTHARHKNIETTMLYVHQRDRLAQSAADFIHVTRRSDSDGH